MNRVESSTGIQNRSTDLTIEGITQPTILRYFEALNAGDFDAASILFAIDGALQPPFEASIVGAEAIATYLKAEAQGITLKPREGTATALEDGCTEIQITGRVKTTLFEVNVAWRFILSPQQEILLAKIKLLASPKELLNLRP
jgi:hypothetical protein